MQFHFKLDQPSMVHKKARGEGGHLLLETVIAGEGDALVPA